MPSARQPWAGAGRGSTRQWRKLRAIILAEHPQCTLCGGTADQVDHIIPVSRGGTDTRSNLRAVCRLCNLRRNQQLTQRPYVPPPPERCKRRQPEPHPGLLS